MSHAHVVAVRNSNNVMDEINRKAADLINFIIGIYRFTTIPCSRVKPFSTTWCIGLAVLSNYEIDPITGGNYYDGTIRCTQRARHYS